ncbi:FMN-dependent dehydrogenase [Corchorus capsularis]|uniref:(S)-2-hydroxy-acid oxidase n=1 Tax=Corchorus capsularis TaxID=210143 RepID=A0A1R3HJS4_COCAP|nr:FMN-dependent dehydrogenase [Corchorus capsularis]
MAVEPVNVDEFRELARQALPKSYYDFFTGGAEDEYTLKENEEAFQRIIIQPRILVYKRRDISAKLVERAEKNGYKAIVLTGDAPRHGRREANIKNKIIVPQLKNLEGLLSTSNVVNDGGSNLDSLANSTRDQSLCWKDIGWLKSITKLPILIKGVLTHEDAIKGLEVGVDGIIVSNHGGRQLDYCPPTISVLEEVVQAVDGKVPVFLDGGVRRGTDVFKAMALGAQAVLVGRPIMYGLAAKGEYGVRRVLEMLKDELELTMALSGCSSVKEITRFHVTTKHDHQLLSML